MADTESELDELDNWLSNDVTPSEDEEPTPIPLLNTDTPEEELQEALARMLRPLSKELVNVEDHMVPQHLREPETMVPLAPLAPPPPSPLPSSQGNRASATPERIAKLREAAEQLNMLPPQVTKSTSIRWLHDLGASAGEISAVLGILYQHAYNVIRAYEDKKTGKSGKKGNK